MKLKPQFSYKEMYITPFSSQRSFDQDGQVTYEPLVRNLEPTGIHLLDGFAVQLSLGNSSRSDYCKKVGISTLHLNSLFVALTGVNTDDFRKYYCLRLADDLLRYTSLNVAEVALRSGFGSVVNMFYYFRSEFDCSPGKRRLALRKPRDVGRFKL